MQVSVTFRHVEPSDALKDYATEKVLRVAEKYLRKPLEAHVILSVVKHRHEAEINIHASRFDSSARECTGDLYSAIDEALDKLEVQLRKRKDRINPRKGRQTGAVEPSMVSFEVIGSDALSESGKPHVIETDNIPAKPLSLEDAISQLEFESAEFLVFRNSRTESISVLYKRRDGNYGLITPDV